MRILNGYLVILIANLASCALVQSNDSSEINLARIESSSHFEAGRSLREAQAYDLAHPELLGAYLEKPNAETLFSLTENEFQMDLSSLALLRLKAKENQVFFNEDPRLQLLIAEIYFKNSLFELARTNYQLSLAKNPNSKPLLWRVFDCNEKLNEHNLALGVLDQLDKLGDDKSTLHFQRGKILASQGPKSRSQAREEFKLAIQLRPDFKSAHLALAQLLLENQQPEESSKLLSQFERKYGPDFDIHKIAIEANTKSGDYEEAQRRLEILSKSESYKLTAYQKMAEVYELQKNIPGRISALAKILEIDKADDQVRMQLATSYLALQQVQEAQKYFLEIYPESHLYIEGQIALIAFFKSINDQASAQFKLSQLMERFPNNPGVRELTLGLQKTESAERTPANVQSENLLNPKSK